MNDRADYPDDGSFGRRGVTPLILNTGRGSSGYMISALNTKGVMYFMAFEQRFDVDVFLQFMKRLIHQADRKIFLIVDEHPVHRDKKVKRWLAGKKVGASLSLFFRPRALCLM